MMVIAYGDDERRRRASDLGTFGSYHQAGGFRSIERAAATAAGGSGLTVLARYARRDC